MTEVLCFFSASRSFLLILYVDRLPTLTLLNLSESLVTQPRNLIALISCLDLSLSRSTMRSLSPDDVHAGNGVLTFVTQSRFFSELTFPTALCSLDCYS